MNMPVASAHIQQKEKTNDQLITNEKFRVVDFPLLVELAGAAETIGSTKGSITVP